MCGRASLAAMPDELIAYLQPRHVRDVPSWYAPRYNIAPSQPLLAIRQARGGREACAVRWGLIPSWARDPGIGAHMINARAETVASKPAYRDAFRRRRALVVVDGYYEWRREPSGAKTPFRIFRGDGAPFTLAALWERWGTGTDTVETCAIVTTSATGGLASIHDRMPVIVADDAHEAWLMPDTSPLALGELLAPGASDALDAHAVSPYVNAPTHDDERCWEAVSASH